MSEHDEAKASRKVDRYGNERATRGGAPGRSTVTSRMPASARAIARAVMSEMAEMGVQACADAKVARAAESSGHALPDGLRARFESSLGADLGGVRVHTDGAAASAAESLGARAYATGQDVYMGAGQYAPDSASGAHLLAHEVAHTVQQRGASGDPACKLEVSSPGDAMETEADAAADAMMAGTRASVSPASGVARHIQRFGESQAAPASAAPGASAPQAQPAPAPPQSQPASQALVEIVSAHFQDLFDAQVGALERLSHELQAPASAPESSLLAPLITAAVVAALNAVTDGAAGAVAGILESLARQSALAGADAHMAPELAGLGVHASDLVHGPQSTAAPLAQAIIRQVGERAAHMAGERVGEALAQTAGQPPVNQFIDTQRHVLLEAKVAARDTFIERQPELTSSPTGALQANAIRQALDQQRARAETVQYFESLRQWVRLPQTDARAIRVVAYVPGPGAYPSLRHVGWPGTSDAVRRTLQSVHGGRLLMDLGADVEMHIVVHDWRPFLGAVEFDLTKRNDVDNVEFERTGDAAEFLAQYSGARDTATQPMAPTVGAHLIWTRIATRTLASIGVMSSE